MIPTSTEATVRVEKSMPAAVEAVAVFLAERAGAPLGVVPAGVGEAVARVLGSGLARGKANEVAALPLDLGAAKGPRVVLAAGVGPAEKLSVDALRCAAGALAKAARKHGVKSLAVVLPVADAVGAEAAAAAIVTGVLLGSFKFREYEGTVGRKKGLGDGEREPLAVTLVAEDAKVVRAAVERARAIAEGQNFARTIATRPGNDINPPQLAKVAQQLAKKVGLDCRVLDEKQLARLGMGGILAVGAGSKSTPPRIIILQHKPAGAKGARGKAAQAPLLVVGKAVTFDTGGISIKPADRMQHMIFDKCGAMAVLGLMYAVATLDLPVPVVGILSSAENHISDRAYRPGDILRMYNGVTVEVTNTDAEGRLVLGDALAWGIETYKPAAVVDLATLTGAIIVALGKTMAGAMSNSDELVAEISAAAARAGEKVWRMPVGDEHREQLKSEFADVVNSAGREASSLTAAAFLSHFVPEGTPWVHLDIAGVADTEKETPLYAKGATGWGVRTLVEWVSGRAGHGVKA